LVFPAAVRSTDRNSRLFFVLEVGQPSASSRSVVSAEVYLRKTHRLQFGEILSRVGRCNCCEFQRRRIDSGGDTSEGCDTIPEPKKGPFIGAIHKTDELMEKVHRILYDLENLMVIGLDVASAKSRHIIIV
jgi:hypothetical protein